MELLSEAFLLGRAHWHHEFDFETKKSEVGRNFCVTGPCEPDTARQRTSLAALHALEVADLKTLQPSNLHTCLSSRCVGFASDSVITVQNAGDPHGREVADGVCVKVGGLSVQNQIGPLTYWLRVEAVVVHQDLQLSSMDCVI